MGALPFMKKIDWKPKEGSIQVQTKSRVDDAGDELVGG